MWLEEIHVLKVYRILNIAFDLSYEKNLIILKVYTEALKKK